MAFPILFRRLMIYKVTIYENIYTMPDANLASGIFCRGLTY